MNARAEILKSQLTCIGDGIAGACAVLARDPRPTECEMLAIRLGGAQRHVLTMADELQRETNLTHRSGK